MISVLTRFSFLRVASLATLVVAFYIIENWRGERAWTAAKTRLRAAGEPVTVDEWRPKPPPDDQNFMLNPVFVRRFGIGGSKANPEKWDYPPTYAVDENGAPLPFPYEALGIAGKGKTDMIAIAAFLPEPLRPAAGSSQRQAAQAVLRWIGQWESDFAVIIESARKRPENYLPWTPGSDLVEHWRSLEGWIGMCKILQLRALAQVTAGDGKGALDSMSLMLRLSQSVAAEPTFLVSCVLSVANVALAILPLNQGLASRVWTEAQLAQLDDVLQRIDVRSDFRRSIRGERFYFTQFVEEVSADEGRVLERMRPQIPGSVLTFFPRGWWRQNLVRAVGLQLEQEQRLKVPVNMRPKLPAEFVPSGTSPYGFLCSLWVKGMTGVEPRIDEIEAEFILGRIAVALERHRLAAGSYPQSLNELAALLPEGQASDPFSGVSPKYSLVDGRPRLISVGPNRQEDSELKQPKPTDADDITWAYPAE